MKHIMKNWSDVLGLANTGNQRRRDHMTAVLHQLHWLPIIDRLCTKSHAWYNSHWQAGTCTLDWRHTTRRRQWSSSAMIRDWQDMPHSTYAQLLGSKFHGCRPAHMQQSAIQFTAGHGLWMIQVNNWKHFCSAINRSQRIVIDCLVVAWKYPYSLTYTNVVKNNKKRQIYNTI